MNTTNGDERLIMVFLRDHERNLGTGYKTRGLWRDGVFDAEPWRRGEFACDCLRGSMLYGQGEFACGAERFQVERIVVWDTGETVYMEANGTRVAGGCPRFAAGTS